MKLLKNIISIWSPISSEKKPKMCLFVWFDLAFYHRTKNNPLYVQYCRTRSWLVKCKIVTWTGSPLALHHSSTVLIIIIIPFKIIIIEQSSLFWCIVISLFIFIHFFYLYWSFMVYSLAKFNVMEIFVSESLGSL